MQTCINGEGNLEQDKGLGDTQINSFDEINEAEAQINSAKTLFEGKLDFPVYKMFKKMLDERETLKLLNYLLFQKI